MTLSILEVVIHKLTGPTTITKKTIVLFIASIQWF